ncbi:MAG: hypothetical protein V4675_14325 [Verrucomicrobiota bacterium]
MHLNPLFKKQASAWACLILAYAGSAAAQTTVIPASFAHPVNQADTTSPGFRIRTVQAETSGTLDTTLVRAESQLAGLLINPATTQPFPNIANPDGFGPDGYYSESVVVDYNQTGGSPSGLGFPGIPGTLGGNDNFSVEVLTYLKLDPGTYTMVVNSDDGFRVTTAPNAQNQLEALTLGFYDGGRGATDSSFDFAVSAAGLYGFRLIYYEGGSDASVSWAFSAQSDPSTHILINDSNDPASIKAYQKLTLASTGIYADVAAPAPNASGIAPKPTLFYRLVDNGSSIVNPASVQLSLDGVLLAPTVAKASGKTTVSYAVPDLLNNLSLHTIKLVFADSAATPNVTTTQYNFTVIDYPNLTIPVAPVISENFDSWTEQTEPPVPVEQWPVTTWTYHGWTVEQHSSGGGAGWDLDNPNSDAYLGWVVLSKDRVTAIGAPPLEHWDAEERLSFPQQFINKIIVPTLVSGNFFYAESDQRGGSQVQYLFSPDFDLAGKSNLYLFFNSIYEQNQDNIGSVEYSIDQGVTWLPILYMIDVVDILKAPNGSTDAEATLAASQGDTAVYNDPDTGEPFGGTYGAFIGAAPATWPTLGPYISGRVNDDPLESKRVEFHRIPKADNQTKVRFRFAQAGTASWFFGIDNFAIYSMPVADGLPTLAVVQQGGKVLLSWPASASDWKLQTSTTMAINSWTDLPGAGVSGDSLTLQITPSSPRTYYRLYK